ncbi:MAG: nucleotide exchange factor GrpE [Anaerolineales bacterium]
MKETHEQDEVAQEPEVIEGEVLNVVEEEVPAAGGPAEPSEAEITVVEGEVVEEEEIGASQEPDADEVAALREALAEAEARAERHLQGWQRAQANYENFRKRVDAERESWTANANAIILSQLLPVLDDFRRAFDAFPDEVESASWVEGMRLVEQKLRRVLDMAGVKRIEVQPGDPFNPDLHQAVLSQESEEFEEGQIIAEAQAGYMQGDRVLRPSMVVVAKASPAPQPAPEEEPASESSTGMETESGEPPAEAA